MIRLRWGLLIIMAAVVASMANCSSSKSIAPNPSPIITSIFPDSITAGSAMFNIDISGQGFLNKPASVAMWNGSPRTTTFNVATGHLTITVLAADVTNPSVALISVMNPAPGGGTSSGASFTIKPLQNGAPTNISLDPSNANAGTKGPFKLSVNGANFVAGSIIRWNGTFRQPTSVTATALTTDLTTTDLALAGFASVSVDNPLPGGIIASSVSVDFLINSSKAAAAAFPQLISVSASGGPADGTSAAPAISADGRFIAFYSTAKNLVSQGASGNVFVRETCLGATNCTPHTLAVDLAPDGGAPSARATDLIAMSADGRFVAFTSYATNLVPGFPQSMNAGGAESDGDWMLNLFVRDMCAGTNVPEGCTPHTELLARGVKGSRAEIFSPSLSAEGRYAVFISEWSSSGAGKSESEAVVYHRDACAGPTATVACIPKVVAVATDGVDAAAMGEVARPIISGAGRFIAFQKMTPAPILGGKPSSQVFLRDACLGTDAPALCVPSTIRISVAPDGSTLDGVNEGLSLSADARFAVFESQISNSDNPKLVAPRNIYLRDSCIGPTASDGCIPSTKLIYSQRPNATKTIDKLFPSISQLGRFISFVADLDENGARSVFIHDACNGALTPCSPGTFPVTANDSSLPPLPLILDRIAPVPLTADGHFAAYYSCAGPDPGTPASGRCDVFLTTTPFR